MRWTVARETGISGYGIERSVDGKTFTAVGTTKATGNGGYAFEDNQLPAGATTLYYRIKSTGMDGGYRYSNIATVRLTTHDPQLRIYPNPVHDRLNITLVGAANGTYGVRITTVAGVTAYSAHHRCGWSCRWGVHGGTDQCVG